MPDSRRVGMRDAPDADRPPDPQRIADEAQAIVAAGERPERRHLSVMFCDLVGSTGLSHALDPEEYRLVLRAYQRACAAVVSRYDGFVSKYEGDDIRVLFGFPRAHEDGAERAARAALDIIEAVSQVEFPEAVSAKVNRIEVHVSIASSMAVVGELIGSGVSMDMPVWGEAPNLASRLKALSKPNTVVVCEATKALLRNAFDLEPLGTLDVDGYTAPVPGWQVLRSQDRETRFEAQGRRAGGAFVGRDGELGAMYETWRATRAGSGKVVLVAGESGVGKSRLVEEFLKGIGHEGRFLLRSQCSPYHANSTLYPIISTLSRWSRDDVDESPSARLTRLEEWLEFRPEASKHEIMTLIADLLSIPVDEGRYRGADMSPEERRDRTMRALQQQTIWFAQTLPTVVLVEDVHWADPSTLELIERSLEALADYRVMLVITHRPEFTPAWSHAHEHVLELALEPLNESHARELALELLGETRIDEDTLQHLIANADGVPLYLEELVASVASVVGTPQRTHDDAALAPEIPASLRESLLARLDTLGEAKTTAEMAAVIGREFSLELLESVGGHNRAALVESLRDLESAGLIRRGEGNEYVFRHPLIRETAYGCMLRERREALHAAVAHAFETRFAETALRHPELVAHHLGEARSWREALVYWHEGGRVALARSANVEAQEHIQRALDIITPADGPDLAQLPDDERRRIELQLHIAQGTAFRATRGFASSDTMRSFQRALALCRQGVGGPEELGAAWRGLYTSHYVRGEHRVSRAMGTELLEHARRGEEPAHLITGHYMVGASMFWQGEFVDAYRSFEDALELYGKVVPADRMLSEQVDLKVTLLNHLAWALWMLGHPTRAMRVIGESVRMAHALPQPFTQAMALFVHGALHASCHGGKADPGRLGALKRISESNGLAFPAACAKVLDGQDHVASGRTRRGIDTILSGMADFDAQEAGLGKPWGLASAALACLKGRFLDQGLELIDTSLRLVDEHGEYQWQAELQRVRGELLSASGESESMRALDAFERAIDIAESQQARALELRARTSLANALARQREPARARGVLENCFESFEEGFDTYDLRRAATTLRELRDMQRVAPSAARQRTFADDPAAGAARLPPALERWRRRGRWVDTGEHRLFTVDEGPRSAPTLMILHGFPTCSFDYHHVIAPLAERYRVVVHDHPGLGLSAKPRDYSYSLIEQTDQALAVWRRLGLRTAHLIAHDYGASIATELLARRQQGSLRVDIASVTLCNASLYPDLVRLTPTQRLMAGSFSGPLLARIAGRGFFAARLARLWGRGAGPDAELIDALWAALVRGGGRAVLARIAGYPAERRRFIHRWIAPLVELDLPVHVLWGREDPLAAPAIATRLAETVPGARLTFLDGCGHFPMLEQPLAWTQAVLNGLEQMEA